MVTDEPGGVSQRRYSGKVTAIIIVAIVGVFLVLNLLSHSLIPRPERPAPRPVVSQRASPGG